jgi:hypothetical protein
MTVTLQQQIASVKREIAMRVNVYAKRVADGKMRKAEAEHELACMRSVLETLQKLKNCDENEGATTNG